MEEAETDKDEASLRPCVWEERRPSCILKEPVIFRLCVMGNVSASAVLISVSAELARKGAGLFCGRGVSEIVCD